MDDIVRYKGTARGYLSSESLGRFALLAGVGLQRLLVDFDLGPVPAALSQRPLVYSGPVDWPPGFKIAGLHGSGAVGEKVATPPDASPETAGACALQ